MSVEKKETAAGTDESNKVRDVGVSGCGGDSLYLYEGQDWVISPACSPEEPSAISPMLAEETFRYMILSSDRIEQMTKTFNDIDVVTHLLAERDRDLELAARIGQSLLQRNQVLQERNESLEEQLAQAVDQVHQLQHELGKKDELLRMVASASEESETDSSCSTPLRHSTPAGAALALGQLEALQAKLQEMCLIVSTDVLQACHLKKETVTYEEKEQQLVKDCVKELRESNRQMVTLTEELSKKNEALLRHQEEIAQLLSQIVELQHRIKEVRKSERLLLCTIVCARVEVYYCVSVDLQTYDKDIEKVHGLKEEALELLHLKNLNNSTAATRSHLCTGRTAVVSAACTIVCGVRERRVTEGEMVDSNAECLRRHLPRGVSTVRAVNQSTMKAAMPPIPGSSHGGVVMTAQPHQSHTEEEIHRDLDATKESSRLGQPGFPGGNDLTSAIHRLSLRRQNFLCERQFFQAERDRKLLELAGSESDGGRSGCSSPMGSGFSSSTNLSEFSFSSSCFKTFLPEKLQIVKPLEGSLTLHHWQQLAKPHLATILDLHPGVVTKGFRHLPQDKVYQLTDLEEDENQEKPSWQRKSKEETTRCTKTNEEDEDDGGITFHVQSSSTPEEKRERSRAQTPTNVPPLPASLRNSPVPIAAVISIATAVNQTASSAGASGISGTAFPPLDLNLGCKAPSTGVNPGKYQSSTFSTYTFTTCRIMHPSDCTQVTPSSVCSPSIGAYTPSSLRTGPSTPVTPCRLSLGDSFPIRRPAAPSGGLTKLLLEKGISAQGPVATEPKKPLSLRLLPSTPPNSPSHSPCPSPTGPPEPGSSGSDQPQESATFLATGGGIFFEPEFFTLNGHQALCCQSGQRLMLDDVTKSKSMKRPGFTSQGERQKRRWQWRVYEELMSAPLYSASLRLLMFRKVLRSSLSSLMGRSGLGEFVTSRLTFMFNMIKKNTHT
ncbi:Trafficking kinesin-binding protein 2 [Triplophysa tibetana]|uniref:Trafficking kinesin-binding protein 2 n=1 Tax=Triplophysa tibetana TaxID=1572043 RepID=A0A5A9NY79_9TELE|nr:Trafficking kinesin-binding protein 2 [Triplophysa tibetana]